MTDGSEGKHAIRGISIKGLAVRRPVRLPRLQRVAWHSRLDRRRWARFRRPARVVAARDCVRRLDWCRGPVRWRCPGAWTTWPPFAHAYNKRLAPPTRFLDTPA